MNLKTISVISLSDRNFSSFEAKLREAEQWLEVASGHGSDLAVLPETLNLYRSVNTDIFVEEDALDDWESSTAPLREAAERLRIAITVPVLIREEGALINTFFLISRTGATLGSYRKRHPAHSELSEGITAQPAGPLIDWDGIKVGGAICFDTWFPDVFSSQADAGAQLFIVPSLWHGGSFLNAHAITHSTPIALAYPAWSRIIDIDGREIVEGGYRHETLRFGFGSPVYTASLNFDRASVHAEQIQHKIRDIERFYGQRLRIRFDQANSLFYLESRAQDLRIEEVLSRFQLSTIQQFLENYKTLLTRK